MENQVKNKIVVWRENFRLDAKYESETNSAESYLEEMRIPEVLQECYDILKSHNELEIIVPILRKLQILLLCIFTGILSYLWNLILQNFWKKYLQGTTIHILLSVCLWVTIFARYSGRL